MNTEVVVGIFHREQLSNGLVAVHRAGFGPHARVLDSARGLLDAQLERAGHQISISFAADDTGTVLILVTAPGRTGKAADTLTRAGAQAVYLAGRTGLPVDPSPAFAPAGPMASPDHVSPPAGTSE